MCSIRIRYILFATYVRILVNSPIFIIYVLQTSLIPRHDFLIYNISKILIATNVQVLVFCPTFIRSALDVILFLYHYFVSRHKFSILILCLRFQLHAGIMTAFEPKIFFVWGVTYICVYVTQVQILPTSSKHVLVGMQFLRLGIGGLSHQSCMSLHTGTNNIVGGFIIVNMKDIHKHDILAFWAMSIRHFWRCRRPG